MAKKSTISIIVAVAGNEVIGKANSLPWHLPAELAYFKKTTTGHPIIMGSKTYESIGRPLPGRTTIVLADSPKYRAEGCLIAGSLEAAIGQAGQAEGGEEIFICGGASVYEQALPLANKLYLTRIKTVIDGDKYFRYQPQEWQEIWSEPHPADNNNPYPYEFKILQRIKS